MSLAELTAAADISVRTVRYYISEGLLPPPEGAGPGSSYSPAHLARLRLIQRLKAAYLPLKEIRRHLAGLEDEEVLAILAREENFPADASYPLPDASLPRGPISLLESRAQYRTEPLAFSIPVTPPAPATDLASAPRQDAPAPQPDRELLRGTVEGQRLPLARPGTAAAWPDEELWRRIHLGDDAELVISNRVYARHQDRIDWLVRWARKVFD